VPESTRKADTIVLDKTGTVTTGKMTLVEVITAPNVSRETLLRYAGALADASEHPVAQAIARGAKAELGVLPVADDFAGVEGKGVHGMVDGRAVVVGRESLLADWAQHLDPALSAVKARAEGEGKTAVAVGEAGPHLRMRVTGTAPRPGLWARRHAAPTRGVFPGNRQPTLPQATGRLAPQVVRFAAVAATSGNAGIPVGDVPGVPRTRLHLRGVASGSRLIETIP
jgi:hypothetical protein